MWAAVQSCAGAFGVGLNEDSVTSVAEKQLLLVVVWEAWSAVDLLDKALNSGNGVDMLNKALDSGAWSAVDMLDRALDSGTWSAVDMLNEALDSGTWSAVDMLDKALGSGTWCWQDGQSTRQWNLVLTS